MPLASLTLFLFLTLHPLHDDATAETGARAEQLNPRSDSVAVIRTVSKFHEALKSGDTLTAKSLLASDLRVLEGGDIENRGQYLSSHLAADIDFAKAMAGERTVVSYTRHGNVAWVVSSSTARGEFEGREVDRVGAELMILSRTPKGWQIRAIHWSSSRRQPR